MKTQLSNQPVKGTADWLPGEFAVRRHIFETWRRVNEQFGYEEYLTPIFEAADIYRAKSGEDVGEKELLVITDPGGRELALRPEMTPSVTRMVTRFYKQAARPLRLFSIANFWRSERPQRGRNREFWQLNTDIFGSETLTADLEILQLALHIMLAFNPPQGSFTLHLNHRHLVNFILTDIAHIPKNQHRSVVRILDRFDKVQADVIRYSLARIGLGSESIDRLIQFALSQNIDQLLEYFPALKNESGYQQITQILTALYELGLSEWVNFNPRIIRGFDYYDGMVFELFDNHPGNNRSLFGGGRYNGLADIFGEQNIPAVGFAPGDETTRLFIENWHLAPHHPAKNQAVYLPLLDESLIIPVNRLAAQLRRGSFQIVTGLEKQSLKQALSYAGKRKFPHIIIYGPAEASQEIARLKDMKTGKQATLTIPALLEELKRMAFALTRSES